MLQPRFEKEIWVAAFGASLTAVRPDIGLHVARVLGEWLWPHLCLIPPPQAVETVLHWIVDRNERGARPVL